MKFILVDVLLVNQSEAATSISSLAQMSLRDSTGQVYDVDFSAQIAVDAASPDGEVSPGERIRGSVGFQVPEEPGPLTFVFDVALFGSGKVFVDLGEEAVLLDPPEELAGQQELETYHIGDVVEVGDVVLMVSGWSLSEGSEFNKPDEGNHLVFVDVTVVNSSESQESVSSLLQMNLRDSTGQIYDPEFTAAIDSPNRGPDAVLLPGERIRGTVGFQTPIDATELTFVFDADIFGTGS